MIGNTKTEIRKCFLRNNYNKSIFTEKLKLYNQGTVLISYAICKKSGLVYQNRSLSRRELEKYYSQFHFSLENASTPSDEKLRNFQRYLHLINQEFKNYPKSVLEISLFNLFLLKQFLKRGSKIVHGLEPNQKFQTRKIGKIKIFNNTIEKFKSKKKYDLIILTHVLEHLMNPLEALKKCSKLQNFNQKILVEVPLFDKIELYPIAGLTMEHIYYFSEDNLRELLAKAGYEILSITKTYNSTQMPFITVVAQKVGKIHYIEKNDQFKNQAKLFKKYLNIHRVRYKKINSVINKINRNKPTYLYGVGMTASSFVFHSNIQKKLKVPGIFDGNTDKIGGKFGELPVLDYNKLNKKNFKKNIIITSEFSSDIISQKIKSKNNIIYKLDKKYGLQKIR